MTSKNYFAYLLMFYIASTLIFAIGSNIFITRILNVVLLGSFLIYFLTNQSIKLHIHKFLWFYVYFAIFSLFSVFWSIDVTSSIKNSFIVIIIAINLVVIYNISRYFKIERFILYGILLGAWYNYAILLDFIPYVSEYTLHFKHRFVGTTNNPNVLAIYMLFSIVSSIILLQGNNIKVWKIFLSTNIFLALYSIVMTASKKGAIFSLMLLSIYFLSTLKSKKSIFWLIVLSIIFLIVLNSGVLLKIEGFEHLIHRFDLAESAFTSSKVSGSTYERIYLIETAYKVFSQDFGTILFGSGQQTFHLQNKLGLYAHNNYMEIIANLGLIGIVLFYSIYYFLVKNIMMLKDKGIRYFLFGFMFILLLMDNALVSYTFKPLYFMFIFIVIYIENEGSLNTYEKS